MSPSFAIPLLGIIAGFPPSGLKDLANSLKYSAKRPWLSYTAAKKLSFLPRPPCIYIARVLLYVNDDVFASSVSIPNCKSAAGSNVIQ